MGRASRTKWDRRLAAWTKKSRAGRFVYEGLFSHKLAWWKRKVHVG